MLPQPLNTPEDLKSLNFDADVSVEMRGTLDAITLTRKKLEGKVPLLGFCGAPVSNFIVLFRMGYDECKENIFYIFEVDPIELHD